MKGGLFLSLAAASMAIASTADYDQEEPDTYKQEHKTGFTKLLDMFKTMEGDREKSRKDATAKLNDLDLACKEYIDERKENIADATSDRDAAAEREKTAEEAAAAAEEERALQEQNEADAKSGKEATIANFAQEKKRLNHNLSELTTASDALGQLAGGSELAQMTPNTQAQLKNLIEALQGKLDAEKHNLNEDMKTAGMTGADGTHQQTLKNFDATIADYASAKDTAAKEKGTQNDNANTAKGEKVGFMNDLQDATAEKQQEEKRCRKESNALKNEIKIATTEEQALEQAIAILSQGSAVSFVEVAQVSSGFMSSRDPRKPLLDLLSKYGKTSTAGRFIQSILAQSKTQDKKVGAFESLKSEIQALISTLNAQQDQDLTDMNWCQKKDDELTTEKTTLTESVNILQTEISGHENKRDNFKKKTQTAEKAVTDAHDDKSNNMDKNDQYLRKNKEDFQTMQADLSLLKQAYAQLESALQGVATPGSTDEKPSSVLDTVDKLIISYTQAIEENKNVTRDLEGDREDIIADHKATVKREQNKVNRMRKGAKDQTALVAKKTDKRFATDSDLQSAKNSYDKIFTAEDGKCNGYNTKIPERRSARETEIKNLHSALAALSEYMESIGIRMSF